MKLEHDQHNPIQQAPLGSGSRVVPSVISSEPARSLPAVQDAMRAKLWVRYVDSRLRQFGASAR